MRSFLNFCLSLPFYTIAILIGHALTKLPYRSAAPLALPVTVSFLIAITIFIFICKFKPVYIFGHELAHWIFAKLFFKETNNFKVGRNSGAVEVKNPNIIIALAPYFYPTFTILWLPFWLLAKYFEPRFPYSITTFFSILAITWAYHIALTLYSFKFSQPDFTAYGKPLSFAIILAVNTLVIFLFLSWLTAGIPLGLNTLWQTTLSDTIFIYTSIRDLIF